MTKRVLVTGARGFVGQNLLAILEQEDVELTLVLREDSRKLPPIPGATKILTTPDMFSESESWWQEACQGIHTIVHLAWYVEPGKYLDSPKNLDCLTGSILLAKAAATAGVKRFVGIGTCFEYDLEPRYLSVKTPLNPLTVYAAAKAALFLTLSRWFSLNAIEFAWCRLFYLYGAGEDNRRLVPYIRSQLEVGAPADLTAGDQICDFMDVGDAAKIIADTILGKQQGPVNVCSGIPTSVRTLAESVADEYGRPDLLNFGARTSRPSDPACVVGIPNKSKNA